MAKKHIIFNILNHWGMEIKNIMRYHYAPIRKVEIKKKEKTDTLQYWQGYKAIRTLTLACGGV